VLDLRSEEPRKAEPRKLYRQKEANKNAMFFVVN
jgi:hypothetical protein